jgi:chorismate--pyruvate lyase
MMRARRNRLSVTHQHPSRFGQHAFEPIWGQVPKEMASWLFDASSLTARIINACSGEFRVEVISQGWQRPMLNEEQCLKIRAGRHALIRQVHLYCDDKPWVFARTVIPHTTLRGKELHLAHLQNKPLGAVLFSEPTMRRSEVEVAEIRPGQSLFHTATARLNYDPAAIWGRRSVFYLHGKPLLVSEIFLPDIPHIE